MSTMTDGIKAADRAKRGARSSRQGRGGERSLKPRLTRVWPWSAGRCAAATTDARRTGTLEKAFLDGENVDIADVMGEGYVGREVDAGVFFAIDKKVLGVAAGQAPTSASERQQRLDEVFGILAHRAIFYRERRTEEVSPGPDGMLLIDRRPGGIRPRRKKV